MKWCNYMAMEDTLEKAKHVWPKDEWEDIRCYVEYSEVERLRERIEKLRAVLQEYDRVNVRPNYAWLTLQEDDKLAQHTQSCAKPYIDK